MQILVADAVVFAVAALFTWLATRAWGARNGFVKWGGLLLCSVLTLVLVGVGALGLVGYSKLYSPHNNPVATLQVAGTPEQRARGERLAQGCAGCHSAAPQPPLDGGVTNFLAFPGGPSFGTLYAPNLTPAGPLKDWSDGEIVRAIREGLERDGRPLLIMPSEALKNLSDADVQSLVAYLRSTPAVQHDTPPTAPNLLAALLVGAGLFPTSAQEPITSPIVAPPPGPTPAYGGYLVSIYGCPSCHGANLQGGPPGFGPQGPNLSAVPFWGEADFMRTIRTGVNPGGHALDNEEMPWMQISNASSDDDLRAIFAYISGQLQK